MKLKEAFAKKAYRNRNGIQGQHCTGTAGKVTYNIRFNEQLDADQKDEVTDQLYGWLQTIGERKKPDWDREVRGQPQRPGFAVYVTVPGTVSLQEVVDHIDSFVRST